MCFTLGSRLSSESLTYLLEQFSRFIGKKYNLVGKIPHFFSHSLGELYRKQSGLCGLTQKKLAPVKKRPFAKKGPKEIIAAELRTRHGADVDEAVAVVSASRAAVSGAESADHGRVGPTYLTFIIDEAHLMRNDHAYWSLLAIAMGAEAQRVIPATGTPFNLSLIHI